MTIRIHDNVFDKVFLDEMSLWLMHDCNWKADNVANRRSQPYGIEGSHRLLGSMFYTNNELSAEEYYRALNNDNNNKLSEFLNMYEILQNSIQSDVQQCMLQAIHANLQFYGMNGTFHLDGQVDQTVFIIMLAYHEITSDMGGEFYHERSGTWTTSPTAKIPFKQGRIIEMTANETHRADAFNVPHIPRFSLKFTGLNHISTSNTKHENNTNSLWRYIK